MIIKVWLFEHILRNKFYNADVKFEYYKISKYIPDGLMVIHISNYYGDFYYSIGYTKFSTLNNVELLEFINEKYVADVKFYIKGEKQWKIFLTNNLEIHV